MIKHVVVFRFRPDLPESEVKAILGELDEFPRRFPAMKNWSIGENMAQRDDTYTHTFVVEFDDADELVAYLHSPEHEAFVAERWRPSIAQRAIVSYEC